MGIALLKDPNGSYAETRAGRAGRTSGRTSHQQGATVRRVWAACIILTLPAAGDINTTEVLLSICSRNNPQFQNPSHFTSTPPSLSDPSSARRSAHDNQRKFGRFELRFQVGRETNERTNIL